MAAFSYQHHPLPYSAFLPNTNINISGFQELCFSYHPSGVSPQISTGDKISEKMGVGTVDEAELVGKCTNGFDLKGKQDLLQSSMEKKRKNCNENQLNSSKNKETTEGKRKKPKSSNSLKEREVENLKVEKKKKGKFCAEPSCGYIHVRARRGQATDSHSLAERVRREKISERMKLLQDLVPGCDKVTGKALLLDEIINYVQSLQNQVEFLSMKLASVNPMFYDFGFGFEDHMVDPKKSRSLTPPLPSLQQSSEAQPTLEYQQFATTVNATVLPTTNSYPLLDTSLSVLPDDLKPNHFSQENGNFCWNMEDQKQRFIIEHDCFSKMGFFQ